MMCVLCHCVAGWVSDVRDGGEGVKIVPRVLLEGWTMADFQEVFATDSSMAQVGQFLVERLKVRGLDKYVVLSLNQMCTVSVLVN